MRQSPTLSQPKSATEPDQATSATRAMILAAATPLFASSGMQGVTIRQIAAAARVNSQLIYYYFGDKAGLFRAALEGAAGRVAALLARAGGSDGVPQERLARFITDWVKVTLEEAPTLRMLHRAMLEGDSTLVADIQRYSSGHAAQIGSLIDEGKASTAFRADLDTRRAVASLVGMVQYLAVAETILFPSTKLKLNRAEREAMGRHTAELFLKGVAAGPKRELKRSAHDGQSEIRRDRG
jgi:TetR/AcrR family transcriptional regulator